VREHPHIDLSKAQRATERTLQSRFVFSRITRETSFESVTDLTWVELAMRDASDHHNPETSTRKSAEILAALVDTTAR